MRNYFKVDSLMLILWQLLVDENSTRFVDKMPDKVKRTPAGHEKKDTM